MAIVIPHIFIQRNIDNITKYAKAIDTAILVKNAPSYAALGFGGEGYCTFTIASRTGEGLHAQAHSPREDAA